MWGFGVKATPLIHAKGREAAARLDQLFCNPLLFLLLPMLLLMMVLLLRPAVITLLPLMLLTFLLLLH